MADRTVTTEEQGFCISTPPQGKYELPPGSREGFSLGNNFECVKRAIKVKYYKVWFSKVTVVSWLSIQAVASFQSSNIARMRGKIKMSQLRMPVLNLRAVFAL